MHLESLFKNGTEKHFYLTIFVKRTLYKNSFQYDTLTLL